MKEVMVRRITGICAAFALPLLHAGASAEAADLTEVADAFDEANDNPFDFRVTPTFRQRIERGRITREAGCRQAAGGCGDLERTVFNRELDYRRVINNMDIDIALGLYKDLEFRMRLPIVIRDQRRLSFDDGVNQTNSTVYPNVDAIAADLNPQVNDLYGDYFGTYAFFDVPNDGPARSGFGDMRLGIAWSPFSEETNPHNATMTVSFDYVAPTGQPARGSNQGVGRGVHELEFAVAASKRLRNWFDPYFGLRFNLPVAASNGLFESHPNSKTTGPGARFMVTTGTELIMASDRERQYHYAFDFGFDFGYQLEGRDYSPLFDAFAGSPCNGRTAADAGAATAEQGFTNGRPDGNAYRPDPNISPANAACAWVVQQPGNARTRFGAGSLPANVEYRHDGITDVEGFGTVGGHIGLNMQFNRYVQFRFRTDLLWDTPHFLTAASSGRDANNDGVVDLNPVPDPGTPVERNPNYNPTIDAVGRRFRIENALNIQWQLGLRVMF